MRRAPSERRMLAARLAPVLRALVIALLLPLASSGALPLWARLVDVEGPHVCHCSVDSHDCVCPRCGTDPDGERHPSQETLRGRCGDDEHLFGSKGFVAALGSSVIELAPAPSEDVAPAYGEAAVSLPPPPPPTPPPRA